MSDRRNNGVDLLAGLLIGGALGAGFALLYAPQSGKKLRKDIRKRSRKLQRDAEGKIKTAQKDVDKFVGNARDRIDKIRADSSEFATDLKDKTVNLVDDSTQNLKKSRRDLNERVGEVVGDVKDWTAQQVDKIK